MFESLPESKPDAILALMAAFREDPRDDKLDLGVGVYKDTAGRTPVMTAVKEAEKRLLATQDTKAYVGPTGSAPFCQAMMKQVFGNDADLSNIRCVQSVGGSGALRVLADLMHGARPDATVWVSNPSWPNHVPLLTAAGFTLDQYPYYNNDTSQIDVDAMLATLSGARKGDIVVLHGCCHNPTGADLAMGDWERIASLIQSQGLFAFVDLAYQGFGDGLEQDAAAVRYLASQLSEFAVAASCSKNLGLYRERVGAAMIKADTSANADRTHARLSSVIRSNYSMPPDHGANVTHHVLTDESLNQQWREELESMRVRMLRLRTDFAAALRQRSNSERFDYIAGQKGMFSRLPLSKEQIESLRRDHGVYIVGDGRINVAGLPDDSLDDLAEKIVSVL